MNPDFTNSTSQVTNSTSQVNDPAVHFGQPSTVSWLSLPNSIQASRFHLSQLRAPPHVRAPQPYVSSSLPYVNAQQIYINAPPPYVNAPQVPLDFSMAAAVPRIQSTTANKNSTSASSESSQPESSTERIFVVGPAFSLADSHEAGTKLQNLNVSQTISNDSHQLAPLISNIQTFSPYSDTHSDSVSGPKVQSTQEPQICIGSVFSLADSHIEHTGQDETENEVNHVAIEISSSQQTKQECLALPHGNQQNKTNSATEKTQDTAASQLIKMSAKQKQHSALSSALNSPLQFMSPLCSSNTNETNIQTEIITTPSTSSASVEPFSAKTGSQLLLGSGASLPTSTAHLQSISEVKSIKDARLNLPVNQKDGSNKATETKKKRTDVLKGEDTCEKSSLLTKPQDSSSTSQMLPNACRDQEPEVVDLDTEDIDDCLLVKIDLSRHHFPYGSKIHNSEVVIDDSDNDEDATDFTKETKGVSSGETTSRKCGELKSGARSTAVVSENDSCGPTGSLSMEVEEINTEASKLNGKNATAAYTMCSTGETRMTSVMVSRTISQPMTDKTNSEMMPTAGSCSTWCSSEAGNPEPELMDLHVEDDDDAPFSTVEYVPLKVLTPSQPNKNMSTPVIQSMLSSGSLLGNTSDIHILKESYYNPFLQPSVQGRIIESMLTGKETPHFLTLEDVRSGQVSQMMGSLNVVPTVGVATPQSHDLQLNSTAVKITASKSSHKATLKGKALKSTTPKLKGKALKSTTPKPKISSTARAKKKSSSLGDIGSTSSFPSLESRKESENSVMCKLCFMFFSSRMELVTHTWNCHRSSQFTENSHKCDKCEKCFANKSLLKLHHKVKCTSSDTSHMEPGTVVVSLDSILHTLLQNNTVGETSKVCPNSGTFMKDVEPQPRTTADSSDSAVITGGDSAHLDVSGIFNSCPQRIENHVTGVIETDLSSIHLGLLRSTDAETNKGPSSVTGDSGEKPVHEEDIKPIITSTGEIQQRSQRPDQGIRGGNSSGSNRCNTCQKVFTFGFQLTLHQQVCKTARNDDVICFSCGKTFTSSIMRYLHVLNNPECKDKINRYCHKCSRLFHSLSDKQNHLSLSKYCQLYEEQLMEDVTKNPLAKNVGHIEQNTEESGGQLCQKSATCDISEPGSSNVLAQQSDNSTQTTDIPVPKSLSCQLCKVSMPNSGILQQHFQMNPACKSHNEKLQGGGAIKPKPPIQAKPCVTCPACKKKFATSAVLILHFNGSPKCRMKICSPSKVAKKVSASDRINMMKPVVTPKSPGRASMSNVTKSSSALVVPSRNVFCDIPGANISLKCAACDAEFPSGVELAKHYTKQKSCRDQQNTKTAPNLKNLKIVLRRVSVMCQVCHSPFSDDVKLAEHLRLNQSCQKRTAEREQKGLELKKPHFDSDTFKRDGKKRSCEIVTGISNVTSTISMASTKDGCITLAVQTPVVDNSINERLTEVDDGHILNISSAKEKYVGDKGNADESDKDGVLSSISSSEDGSDVEESSSSSVDENTDYTCKQCCKTFTSKSLLRKHNKSHHHSVQSKRTHCKVCTRKFHDLTGLQAHLLQFKFCFIPLTRPLWEQKQDPQVCTMCKKALSDPKDLRKHCFKKMACRLRYVNMVLKNMKEKDNASVLPSAEAELPMSKTVKETYESQSANEVSSSVQDYCNPMEVDSSTSEVDVEDETSHIKISEVMSKPLIECLNCGGFFDDFHEHLVKQQSCLDFFGIHEGKCPVPLPFCFQCKTHFDDIGLLRIHVCKGFVAYTHACQTCGLKFTSANNLNTHFQQSLTCDEAGLFCTQKKNLDTDRTIIDSYAINQQGGTVSSSSVAKDVPASSGEQSFPCLICDGKFPTLRLLMEHSYQHVEETPISCDRCNITFLHYNQFVSHQAFHIRMDKEANILVEKPQLSKCEASTSTDQNIVRDQHGNTMSNNVSTCVFCHQEFATMKAKLAHLSRDYACLAIMRYIIENKFFIHNQEVIEPFERRVTDPNCCEFCNKSFSDKFSHYLNSACLGILEAAILSYRSCAHPTPCKEIESAVSQSEPVSQSEQKETDTRYIFMRPQGEHHFSREASMSKDPISSAGEFPEEMCCLKCGVHFRTVAEVKNHQTLWGHKKHLPRSVVESADWQLQSLRCKICNVTYSMTHTLVKHMINKHCNKESGLFHEVGYTSSCCSICKKQVMSSSMQFHFEQHKKKFLAELREKSEQPLRTFGQELCIFCNRTFLSRKYVICHMKRHTHADIFTPQTSKANSGLNSEQYSAGFTSKHVEKSQKLGPTRKNPATSNIIVGSCKLCQKQFTQMGYHKMHFRFVHKQFDPQSWREWYMPLVGLKQEYSPTKKRKTRSVFKKHRCRLCHKAFVQLKTFKTHFKLSHADFGRGQWEEFIDKVEFTDYKQITVANIFQSESLKNENADIEIQSSDYVSAILKSCGRPQFANVGASKKAVKSHSKITSCKVCHKKFYKLKSFKIHFKHAHREYNVGNWDDFFDVIGTAYPKSTDTGATASFSCPQSASEMMELEHTDIDSNSRDDDNAVLTNCVKNSAFDTDVQNVSVHSVSKKTAKVHPVGSCKICHKTFTNFAFFNFHLKKSHSSRCAPEDQRRFFKAFVPSHREDDIENSDSEDSASLPSLKSQQQKTTSPEKSKALSTLSSLKLLLRVCRVCQATFRDVSLYQIHLRKHLKTCKIKLQDIHSQLIPNIPTISEDCLDTPVKIEADAIIDLTNQGQNEEECLYPDTTSSEDDKSVKTTILDKSHFQCMAESAEYGSDSQCMAESAEYGGDLELSTQDELKNSAGSSKFTNAEGPKSKSYDSVISESHIDFVIDASKSRVSVASHTDDCMIRNGSASLDMFSDDENDDIVVPNEDERSDLASSTFGNIVHNIVDTLLNDCLSDQLHEKTNVETDSVPENSLVHLHLNQISPNVGAKRTAQEADLGQEQCSDIKRSKLTQETFCKDQVAIDSSHFPESDSCEKGTTHEVIPYQNQSFESRRHDTSYETLQLSNSVSTEKQEISEPLTVSENVCEMRRVDEADLDQVQNVKLQSCEMSCETSQSSNSSIEEQDINGPSKVSENVSVGAADLDQVQNVKLQSCEIKFNTSVYEDNQASYKDNLVVDKPSDVIEHWDTKANEIDQDREQSSELSKSNFTHEILSLNNFLSNDNVIDEPSDVAGNVSCENTENSTSGKCDNLEAVPFRNSLCGEEQVITESSNITESGCDTVVSDTVPTDR